MSNIVIGICVAAKWVLTETDSQKARQIGADTVAVGCRLIVLDLVFAEVGNAIWKQHYRGKITQQEADQLLIAFNRSPVEVEESRRLLAPAMAIAGKYRRSFYDSLFVALVADLQLPGVTSDEPLYRAVHPDYPQIILLRDW